MPRCGTTFDKNESPPLEGRCEKIQIVSFIVLL
jgi:hypothetical protein